MSYEVERVERIADVPRDAWDRLVGSEDPFTEHAFLDAMEQSGSVGARSTGWIPRHLVVRRGGALVGAMPLYEKYHSYGEFVFDFGWAEGARRARIPYYPKLVSAVPFTPVTGRRLLVAPDADERAVLTALADAARSVLDDLGASSIHALFCTESEARALETAGFLTRRSFQFHLEAPPEWTRFDDYVGAMRNASRKQVRRERARARSHGLELSMRTADEMGDAEWNALWRLYLATSERKGGVPYLRRGVFDRLRAEPTPRVVASFAHRGVEPVAGALFLWKGTSLYGRYWGSFEPLDALHFELCYYLPIEWGLARGMRRFEAGAQGQHKLKRGLVPNACWSAHYIAHPALAAAIREYVSYEGGEVAEDMELLGEHGPFRRGT